MFGSGIDIDRRAYDKRVISERETKEMKMIDRSDRWRASLFAPLISLSVSFANEMRISTVLVCSSLPPGISYIPSFFLVRISQRSYELCSLECTEFIFSVSYRLCSSAHLPHSLSHNTFFFLGVDKLSWSCIVLCACLVFSLNLLLFSFFNIYTINLVFESVIVSACYIFKWEYFVRYLSKRIR